MFLPFCMKLTIKTPELMLHIRLLPLFPQDGDIFLTDFISLLLKKETI